MKPKEGGIKTEGFGRNEGEAEIKLGTVEQSGRQADRYSVIWMVFGCFWGGGGCRRANHFSHYPAVSADSGGLADTETGEMLC